MKSKIFLNKGAMLILLGGLVLFCIDYFLPADLALQGATFAGASIGYLIYLRVNNWELENGVRKNLLMFAITILMSAWASICLLLACDISPRLPLCTENRRNGFIILNFFFPMLIVFFSWLSNRWLRSRT